MENQETVQESPPGYLEARAFLVRRGIQPENGNYSTRQLARELTRRGWRWDIDDESVRATKAYTPSGTVSQSFLARGNDTLALLASVLVNAIRFDDENGYPLVNPYRADIVVRTLESRIIALVEVKNSLSLTSGF